MWEYLLSPLDANRVHQISDLQIWHSRLMFLGWGVVAPLAVMIARYFKVLPTQDWPNRLDSQFWWRCHWIGQTLVLLVTLIAAALMFWSAADGPWHWHRVLGYWVVALVLTQVLLGYLRGSKGGPADPQPDGSLAGDHYHMTKRRRIFEALHKSLGYLTLLLAAITILLGLWYINSPRWMWLLIVSWWCVLLGLSVWLQRRGMALDTYQAIWGPDPVHPGNRLPIGWGMIRREPFNPAGVSKPAE